MKKNKSHFSKFQSDLEEDKISKNVSKRETEKSQYTYVTISEMINNQTDSIMTKSQDDEHRNIIIKKAPLL